MRYSELTRRYFNAAPHAGALLKEGMATPGTRKPAGMPHIFRGAAGNRERGTWVQYDIQVQSGLCLDTRFLAFGCPHTIAVAEWVAEQAVGGPLRAALPETVAALAQRFEVPAEKMGRLLIVEDAWQAAVQAAMDSKSIAGVAS